MAGRFARASAARPGISSSSLRCATTPDGADDEDEVRRIPLLRAFSLFHASQIDGIPDYVPPTIEEAPWRAPEAAEIILANSGAVVRYRRRDARSTRRRRITFRCRRKRPLRQRKDFAGR